MENDPHQDEYYNYRNDIWKPYRKAISNWNRRFRDPDAESKDDLKNPYPAEKSMPLSNIPEALRSFGERQGGVQGSMALAAFIEAINTYSELQGDQQLREYQERFLDRFLDASTRTSLGIPQGPLAPHHVEPYRRQRQTIQELITSTIEGRQQVREQPK